MKFANATNLDRKCGERRGEPALSEVEGDLQLHFRARANVAWANRLRVHSGQI